MSIRSLCASQDGLDLGINKRISKPCRLLKLMFMSQPSLQLLVHKVLMLKLMLACTYAVLILMFVLESPIRAGIGLTRIQLSRAHSPSVEDTKNVAYNNCRREHLAN